MKTLRKLFLLLALVAFLGGCWGDDADSDNTTNPNKLTSIKLTTPSSFKGKYEIISYKEIYASSSINSGTMNSFAGEVIIETEKSVPTLDYTFVYRKDNDEVTRGRKLSLVVGDANKLKVDETKLNPRADNVHAFSVTDKYLLTIKIEGITDTATNLKHDLEILCEKISDNPEFEI